MFYDAYFQFGLPRASLIFFADDTPPLRAAVLRHVISPRFSYLAAFALIHAIT